MATKSTLEVGVPVLTQFKRHVASLVSLASGLTPDDAIQLVEERFDDDFDLSVAMMKIRKFKITGEPSVVANEWHAKVRPSFCPSLASRCSPLL